MAELFNEARREGWTTADVARVAGIAESTATWWKRKLRMSGDLDGGRPDSFAEIIAADGPLDGNADCRAVIDLGNGIQIEVHTDVVALATIVKELMCWR